MLVGIYLGQYCITTLTWFFLTWFPVYLSQARHLSIMKVGFAAALPALCGGTGGILGGVVSDRLLRAGHSLSFARKTPIIAGMLLSVTMIGCNYAPAQAVMLLLMSLSFFGKGFGSLGWTVISDTSPKGMVGLNGALFNLIGNLAGITTPIIIGYLVKKTGSFDDVLIFVGMTALCAIVSYGPIVGEIKRLDLKPSLNQANKKQQVPPLRLRSGRDDKSVWIPDSRSTQANLSSRPERKRSGGTCCFTTPNLLKLIPKVLVINIVVILHFRRLHKRAQQPRAPIRGSPFQISISLFDVGPEQRVIPLRRRGNVRAPYKCCPAETVSPCADSQSSRFPPRYPS